VVLNITLDKVVLRLGTWSLAANGVFGEGIHLISGDVGSGKSTLAQFLAGMIFTDIGTIHREEIASVMISFQFPEFHITGATLTKECESWGLDPHLILPLVNLTEKAGGDPLKLSRGELKRLHLACVLEKNYDLLILDEPFSSLDCAEKERICNSISKHSRGITLIFTHEQSTFPRIDWIWEIREHSLRFLGSPPEALAKWSHAPPLLKQLIASGKKPKNISPDDLLEAACRT
jgi:energy-coupling factor transport system ATP-binding protein